MELQFANMRSKIAAQYLSLWDVIQFGTCGDYVSEQTQARAGIHDLFGRSDYMDLMEQH